MPYITHSNKILVYSETVVNLRTESGIRRFSVAVEK